MPLQTIHSQASASASASPPPSSPNNLLFTCTFCWHLSTGPPRVACGELVFCGDEAVSLGWCFWHRACYGCLLCGNRAVAVGPPAGDLFRDEDEKGGGERARAKEIEEIPMCGHCVVACEVDSLDREQRAQRALRGVDMADGGLSRKKWERERERERRADGSAVVSRKATGAIRRVPGKISRAVEGVSTRYQQPPPQSSPPRGRIPHQSHLTGDGTLSGQTGSNDSAVHCVVPLDSTIYVSLFDPTDGPSFKPSPTKPIPRWMRMLPGQRTQYRKRQPRPRSILDAHFRPSSSTMSVKSPPLILCPTTTVTTTTTKPSVVPPLVPASTTRSTPPTPRRSPLSHLRLRRRKSRESMSSHFSELETSPDPGTRPLAALSASSSSFRGHSFVADEPLQRPLSHVARRQNRDDDDADEATLPHPTAKGSHGAGASSPPQAPSPQITPPAQSTEFLCLYRSRQQQQQQQKGVGYGASAGNELKRMFGGMGE
ncbi:hypothetical protein F4775DRAFT_598136 [Biscogniauxia sp. FL1348]|nr:hypothetical protein F4775DRAFT_598136 [Biscogniauxia sp. FL1348]